MYRLDLIEAQALIFHEGPAQQHYTLATTYNILSECAAISGLPLTSKKGRNMPETFQSGFNQPFTETTAHLPKGLIRILLFRPLRKTKKP